VVGGYLTKTANVSLIRLSVVNGEPVMKKKIPLFGVVYLPEMEAIALEVLRSGRIAGGPFVGQFETEFGKLIGASNVVSTVDMTSALFLALHLAGVNAGDEVLASPFACLSTNSAIAQHKAIPIWVDVRPDTVEMDVNDLESKITEKTKAVILYHIAGYPGPAKEIAAVCKKRNIVLIEDCNNSLLASRNNMLAGSHGDFAIYSFYPNRQINTTEGGALVCRSREKADSARKLRRFGIDFKTFRTDEGEIDPASNIPEIGWGMTLSNLCSALGCAQLNTVKIRQNQTKNNAEKLQLLTKNIEGIKPIAIIEGGIPAYWVFLLLAEHRDEMITILKQKGIMVSAIHQRNDIYSGFGVNQNFRLPNTEYLQDHIIGIPCGWWLGDGDLERIAAALEAATLSIVPNKNVDEG
jgi:perosamine synthetase